MQQVYSRSYCNISATASRDSSEGLFRSRNPLVLENMPLSICVDGSPVSSEDDGQSTQSITFDVACRKFWDDVAHGHVNTRGWVLQERLLAPRVLHFGRQQLFWECQTLEAAEKYPAGLPKHFRWQSRYDTNTNLKSKMSEVYDGRFKTSKQSEVFWEDGPSRFHDHWSAVVEAYSSTDLTFPSDKLMALSGVASEFLAHVDDEYVAGMWRRHLEAQLCWYRPKFQPPNVSNKRPQYRAPTWSWASIDGTIEMPLPKSITLFEKPALRIKVIDVHLEFVTENTMGLVKGGYLDLVGQLKRCTIQKGTLVRMKVDEVVVEITSEGGTHCPNVLLDAEDDDLEEASTALSLYYMPVLVWSRLWSKSCYLLLECIDPDEGIFRRVGLIIVWREELAKMLMAEQSGSTQFPCRRLEDGLHVIRVV